MPLEEAQGQLSNPSMEPLVSLSTLGSQATSQPSARLTTSHSRWVQLIRADNILNLYFREVIRVMNRWHITADILVGTATNINTIIVRKYLSIYGEMGVNCDEHISTIKIF